MKRGEDRLEIVHHPMADGGDESLMAISNHLELTEHRIETIDSLGRSISFTESQQCVKNMKNC